MGLYKESHTTKDSIPDKEVKPEIRKVAKNTVQDLREISRKSNTSLDKVVETFTGIIIGKLEGNNQRG